jgi:glycosyltransferase involved in cell wall biosynthesis
MPRVILEAMASGVPCIATAVGGIPEIINSREVGLLAPPKDPEALARAMIAVAGATDEERERVIQNARHRVRQLYAHEVIAEKLKNLYESRFSAYCKAS